MCGRPVKMKPDTKLKIPLHNEELVIKSVGDANMNPRSKGGNAIQLCPKTNQYKVIRTCGHFARKGTDSGSVTEIHILGIGSWKRIGNAPSTLLHKVGSPTYLNGSLHWLCREDIILTCIMSFNLDSEKFKSLPPAHFTPSTTSPSWNLGVTLGELRGHLYIYDGSGFEQPKVWVMKEYGVQGSWSKEFCLCTQTVGERRIYGLFEPISLLRNGAILLFHSLSSALFYREAKKPGFRFLKFKG
ncbi:hypothetical protein RHSIM_Rhsim07G0063600 [Rhododendron simsii]|uniref:F-box associated beta-propeller type 1 domain-containing protein n=1 Tax=Rhododendron simsii TaxID=118357 RepID=A0A834LIY4_RHOSS|nr:hypothetical protein RHSIM_Rhsim07G0063600 [Rhododendron simsii]